MNSILEKIEACKEIIEEYEFQLAEIYVGEDILKREVENLESYGPRFKRENPYLYQNAMANFQEAHYILGGNRQVITSNIDFYTKKLKELEKQ